MFKARQYRTSLTTDCWTSGQNMNYMVLTAHFIDSYWNLHKRILSFTTIENHRGDTIGKAIEKNLKSWGIDKIMTLTVDNASSNDTVVAYLVRRFSSGLLLNGEFLHIRCCAHILNLIVCDAFKEHYECISRIRNAVRFVRSSPARAMKFKKCIEIEKIACKSLVCLDITTRWNSTYLMLEAATKFEKAFDRLEDEEPAFANECQPTKDDWENARMLVRFLEVFYNVILKILGSLYSTSNVIFHQISTVQNCIQENSMDSDNQILVNVAKSMETKFEKYWGNNERTNLLLYVAVVLDLRYKLRFLSYCFNNLLEPTAAKSMTNKVEDVLRRLFNTYSLSSSSGIEGVFANMGKDEVQPMGVEEKYGFASKFSSADAIHFYKANELDVYLLEALVKNNPTFDILSWWKHNGHRFESAFSTGGRIVDSSRSSLAPRTVKAFICTQNWLNSKPIDIDFYKQFKEDSTIEEGFRMIIDEEKDIEDLDSFLL